MSAATDQDHLPRGDAAGDPRRAARRPARLPDGRGRRPLRRLASPSAKGLLEEFGPERIRDTPLSESAFVGAGIGAALGRHAADRRDHDGQLQPAGARPDRQQRRHARGTCRAASSPCRWSIRMTTGAGRQLAAQHSHSLEGWYAHIPGLKVLAPGDARGCARHARGGAAGSRPGADLRARHALQRGGRARRRRRRRADIDARRRAPAGRDVTLDHLRRQPAQGARRRPSSWPPRASTPRSSTCAAAPARRRRRSSPRSRARTAAVVVDEGWRSRAASRPRSASRITEEAFYELDAPPLRVCGAEVPIPYAKHLEEAALPQVDTIATSPAP